MLNLKKKYKIANTGELYANTVQYKIYKIYIRL